MLLVVCQRYFGVEVVLGGKLTARLASMVIKQKIEHCGCIYCDRSLVNLKVGRLLG